MKDLTEFLKEDFLYLGNNISFYSSYELTGSDYIFYVWSDGERYWMARWGGYRVPFSEVFNNVSESIQKRLIYYLDLFP